MSDNSFRVLSDAEHLLKRSGMYIGSTSLEQIDGIFNGEYKSLDLIPGLLKIFNEILDNSIDEFIRTKGEYGNKIEINIDNTDKNNPSISISDNGRGIPIDEFDGEYRPVLAWTRARAGTNFSDERETMGANGVGSFCTNVFSNRFIGTTCDGKKKLVLVCNNNGNFESVDVKRSQKNGTMVQFMPDMSRFGNGTLTDDHILAIRDRIENLSFCFPGLQFKFNGETIKTKSLKDYADKFGDNLAINLDNDKGAIIFASSGDSEEFRLLSYVNGLYVRNGGSHIDYILSGIIEELRPLIKKKFKVDVLPNQIKQHLLFVSIIRNMKNLQFDSQTKERITNNKSDLDAHLGDIDFKKIAKQLMSKEDIINNIIHTQLQKLKMKEKREADKLAKDNAKKSVAKHVSPNGKTKDENVLYIVEGDSAKSSFMQTRKKSIQGVYPLRGKFLNVSKKSNKDILTNEGCQDIMNILGLNLDTDIPSELNTYGKGVYITADADIDGYCITAQVINFFKLWPELFEKGLIYIVRTPIMITVKNGKTTNVFYKLSDYSKYTLKKGETVKYLKGLGSLTPEQYKEYVIENPRVEQVQLDDEADKYLDIAFSEDRELRKNWLGSS